MTTNKLWIVTHNIPSDNELMDLINAYNKNFIPNNQECNYLSKYSCSTTADKLIDLSFYKVPQIKQITNIQELPYGIIVNKVYYGLNMIDTSFSSTKVNQSIKLKAEERLVKEANLQWRNIFKTIMMVIPEEHYIFQTYVNF